MNTWLQHKRQRLMAVGGALSLFFHSLAFCLTPTISGAPMPIGLRDTQTTPSMPPLAARPALITGGCITSECHDKFASLPVKHGPLLKKQCMPCHIPIGNKHEFEQRQGNQPVCRDCHLKVPAGKPRHIGADNDCLDCHNPHGGKERFFLKQRSGAGLCLDCHAEVAQKQPLHRFMENDGCLACHELHHADDKPLLKAPRDQLCLPCHKQMREGLKQQAGSVHQPVTQDCTLCHRVHGGAQGPALTASASPALCQTCHTDLVNRALHAKYPHKPIMDDQHCGGCHDPHLSKGRALLKATTRELCLGCHDRTYQLADGVMLDNVKAQITQSRYVHGPARQGSCTPCHDAHGSEYPRLLKYDFPCNFYAPFEESRYELCFRCHNRKMVLESQSEVTRFRNGQRNLHYLHVNQEKGRTCRACHHEHASNNPLRIRESVPFGNWNMPLIYKKNENGGSCQSSCHIEYGYNRVKPVDNPVNAAKPKLPGLLSAKP
jgi:predicted CXXCH cytochrome family protein